MSLDAVNGNGLCADNIRSGITAAALYEHTGKTLWYARWSQRGCWVLCTGEIVRLHLVQCNANT
eukprot:6184327-Pleurochrysis_carterae.AAC.1